MILSMNLGENSYDILIEKGAIDKAKELFNLNRKVLIVTDSGVPKGYAEKIKSFSKEGYIFSFNQGEESKNFDTYKEILLTLSENEFKRGDAVVALGGGVVGDMAGFASATYMRGIDFYNIPTTTLSQIDSSIGGKTAIDFMGYKNIVGAFYQPKMVIVDPDLLKTLPERHFNNGLAEAVKMAATFDEKLFEVFEKENIKEKLTEIIEKSLAIKKAVVEKDEKETGLRRVLNFGHTVGHAIETTMNLELLHGECVALGMLYMTSGSAKIRIENVLKKLNILVEAKVDAEKIISAIGHDKKAETEFVNAIFVEEIGTYEIKKVSYEELKKVI